MQNRLRNLTRPSQSVHLLQDHQLFLKLQAVFEQQIKQTVEWQTNI